ncbi:MAG: mycofactocin-coupled SDR family oxidoreductase [Sphaerobacter sp.]|nr:mycofactocin-coupled SDR family oxidoreductase [Sphaerobacter sp.]
MGKLDGKVAIITGGARGQGRSHALTLAREGADIVVCDIAAQIDTVPYPMATPADLEETVRLVEDLDRRCIAVQADVRDGAQMRAVAERAMGEFGRIDILLANAGIAGFASAWELTDEQWNDMIAVNLTGVWQSCKAVIPHMIAGGRGGSIVITSSTAGLKGFAGSAHYVATKHGVVGLMRTLAIELAPYNIRVNTVHPTGVNTPMVVNDYMREVLAASPQALTNLLPVEMVEPVDISNAILWLVSDDARYVTGVTLPVDAGFTVK